MDWCRLTLTCLITACIFSVIAVLVVFKNEEFIGVKNRFDYAIRIGDVALVSGEIDSGKSTILSDTSS